MFEAARQPDIPIGERQNIERTEHIPFYQTSGELGRIMLDSNPLKQRVRLMLLGYIETEDGWVRQGYQLCNEKGASALATLLEVYVGPEVFLTKIDDSDKCRIIKDLWLIIIKLIVRNKEIWALKDDPGSWCMIRAIVVNQAYFALSRGVNAVEKGFFADTYQNKETTSGSTAQQYQKKTFWS